MTPFLRPLRTPAFRARLAAVAAFALAALPWQALADFPRATLTALQPSGGRAGSQVTVTLLGAEIGRAHV